MIDVRGTSYEKAGADLTLTIDSTIQHYVQQVLAQARERWQAR